MGMRIAFCFIVFFFSAGLLYPQYNIEEVANLPNLVSETSGLIHFNGNLVTHNDSGNSTELFELDSETGEIIRSVEVVNASNVDWEDITQDEDFIYVGDFGNNSGNRSDLTIYKIDKGQFASQDQVTASLISFVYEDQSDFTPSPNSDWDAEAIFTVGDFLYILTKEWRSLGTKVYRLPKTEGNVTAVPVDAYNVNGLVTGAVYNEELNQLVVVGYSQILLPFLLTVDQVSSSAPFFIKPTKVELELFPLQIESIASDGQRYYFTSEEYVNSRFGINSKSRLFFFEVASPETPSIESMDGQLVLYGERGSSRIGYTVFTDDPISGLSIFNGSGKELVTRKEMLPATGEIDISIFASGVYYFRFFFSRGDVTKPFIKF